MPGDPDIWTNASNGHASEAYKHSALYEDAALVAKSTLDHALMQHLTDPIEVANVRDACRRILAKTGDPHPYEEPGTFKVDVLTEINDWVIVCPVCDNGIIVHGPTWVEGGNKEEGSRSTRLCPYCAAESYVVDKRPNWKRAKDDRGV